MCDPAHTIALPLYRQSETGEVVMQLCVQASNEGCRHTVVTLNKKISNSDAKRRE